MKLCKTLFASILALVLILSPLAGTITADAATTVEGVNGKLSLSYRYGNANLIQFNTNLPADTPCANFLATDNGCSIDQTGNTVQWVGWIEMTNSDGTIVLTFHFNSAFTAGQSYVLPKNAIFGFTDGKTYALDGDYTATYDGSAWSLGVENNVDTMDLAYRWGSNNVLQVNTNLPSYTPCASFLAADNGSNISQSGNQSVGWIAMDNVDGTIVLTFHFNSAFTAGQTYTLSAGSVFGFTDGYKYVLDRDYTFAFDGSAWSLEKLDIGLSYRYGTDSLIQFNTKLPADTPIANFLATDNGCVINQGGDQTVGWIQMANADGTIVLTFHFNSAFFGAGSYTISAGSLFGFTDGEVYEQKEDIAIYWDVDHWSAEPHEHDYQAEEYPASCTQQGYTIYHCLCGDMYEGNYIDPVGHAEEVIEGYEATCDHFGMTDGIYCGRCNTVVLEQQTIPALGHSYVAETTPADCTNDGKTVYTCSACGDSYEEAIDALGHNYVGVVTTPATCTTDGVKTYTCSNCNDSYEEVIPAGHTIEHVPAVVPANCQETGHDEYWYCAGCDAYFGDAEGSYQVNPAWINYTGEHVRPEGAIVCAVVPCELCGEDSYGEPCDRGDAPVCQDAPCVNCGEIVWGWGCNYNTGDEEVPLPLCQPGDCVYCGTHYEKLYDCENGAWAPCLDGECAYGCGKQYPATAEHQLDDPCAGGMCSQCWNTIEGAHNYESVVTPPTAIKEGYTTHTCSVCGDSYTDSTVPAVGIGELAFSGASLTLYNNLCINFNVNADLFIADAYTDPYVVFQVGKRTVTVSDYTVVDGKYSFACTGISPSQMGDTVYATLYATLDGQQYQVEKEYGVAQYCYNMLNKSDDSELKTLLVDLLNYGAAAQVYASYKNGTLCNADLTEEQKGYATQAVPTVNSVLNTKYATVENAKAKWKAATVYLDNAVNMRFRFAAESIEGLSVKVVMAGKEYIITEFEADAANPGNYFVYFDQMTGTQLRETVYVTVCEGEAAVSNTVTYSVESYVSSKLNDSNAKLVSLVEAIMKYGDAAYAFLY